MHKLNIPKDVIDRVIRHRGREHVYDKFDATRTALLVVDMQNAFMMPGVAHQLCAEAVNIVDIKPAGGSAASRWRHGGMGHHYVREGLARKLAGLARNGRPGPHRDAHSRACRGGVGHQLWAALAVKPDDLTVVKTKYSAFTQGSSPLEATLRQRGIDTVLVAGTVTGVCCDGAARDAMMLNFRSVMVTDANAAMTDEDHRDASLKAFYLSFGDILSTDQIVSYLQTRQPARSLPGQAS